MSYQLDTCWLSPHDLVMHLNTLLAAAFSSEVAVRRGRRIGIEVVRQSRCLELEFGDMYVVCR